MEGLFDEDGKQSNSHPRQNDICHIKFFPNGKAKDSTTVQAHRRDE